MSADSAPEPRTGASTNLSRQNGDAPQSRTGSEKLSVSNVTLTYAGRRGSVTALDGVDLRISHGEIVAIVGVSGCGKSTLLHVIGGFQRPSRGEVVVDGTVVEGPSPDRGIVFQRDAVFPWMTVGDNVAYGLRHGRTKRPGAAAVDEIVRRNLAEVGLAGYEKWYPLQLSGGMRKRVELARVYASNPDLLLLDEPFGALDALTREALQVELEKKLESDPNRTVLLVTHDIEEAIFLADVIAIMTPRPGRISQCISVSLPRPRNRDIALSAEFQELRRSIRERLDAVEDK